MLASAAGHREFSHTGLRDGDEVDLGGLRLRALLTPGHTHEHMAFLLLDGDREIGVFTGGSLLVGSAARTDLISPERTEELTRAQYSSLRRLAALPGTCAGMADPWRRIVLLGAAGHGTHQHHRPRDGEQSAAASTADEDSFRCAASRFAGQLSAVLPPAR